MPAPVIATASRPAIARKDEGGFFPIWFLLPIALAFAARQLIGRTFTGWDTHDLGFVNFVYFRDCLADGGLPLWNPFIQSGTFFPSLFAVGNYSLFQLPFAILALVIPPMQAYEWLLQSVVFAGGLGAYAFFRSVRLDRDLACLGAAVYSLTTLAVNVGQIWFIFSLSALPWMLAAVRPIIEGRWRLSTWALLGILGGFAFASGYQWMNLVNTAVFTGYAVWTFFTTETRPSRRNAALRLAAFLGPLLAVHISLIYPGLSNLRSNYASFAGDYSSPEPRLRSLSGGGWSYTHSSIGQALLGSMHWAAFEKGKGAGWMLGAGWVTVALLVASMGRRPRPRADYVFWATLFAVGLVYASAQGLLASVVRRLPLFSSNRWWVLGVDYSVIALVVTTFLWLRDAFGDSPIKATGRGKAYLFAFSGLLAIFLVSQGAPWYEPVLVLSAAGVLGSVRLLKVRRHQIVALFVLALVDSVILVRLLCPGGPGGAVSLGRSPKTYIEALAGRQVRPVVENVLERRQGRTDEYDYTDEGWYIRKSPYSHGYDPLGNPIHWYVKDSTATASLFTVTSDVRVSRKILRSAFPTDAAFARAVADDILSRPDVPTIDAPAPTIDGMKVGRQHRIIGSELRPNEATVRLEAAGPALVSFNNNYAPGWTVSVDGQEAPLVRVNHIFMGAWVATKGAHEVHFGFRPWRVVLPLVAPYVALAAVLTLWWAGRRMRVET